MPKSFLNQNYSHFGKIDEMSNQKLQLKEAYTRVCLTDRAKVAVERMLPILDSFLS